MRAAFFGAVAKSFKLSAAGCGYFPTLFLRARTAPGEKSAHYLLGNSALRCKCHFIDNFSLPLLSLSRLGRRVCVIEIARACR
jgi:hypothetical protein